MIIIIQFIVHICHLCDSQGQVANRKQDCSKNAIVSQQLLAASLNRRDRAQM